MAISQVFQGDPGLSPVGYAYAPTYAADPTAGTPYDFATGLFTATPAQPSTPLTAGAPYDRGDGVMKVNYTFTIASTPQSAWPDTPAQGPFFTLYAYDAGSTTGWPTLPIAMAAGDEVGGAGSTPRPGTLALSAATYAAGPAPGTAAVTVARTAGADGAVGVTLATSDGTAVAGTDYTAVSGPVSFADGQGSATVAVTLLARPAGTAARTFTVTLTSATGGATLGGQASATVTIAATPAAGTPVPGALGFAASTYAAGPAPATATIGVARSGGLGGAVAVHYATADGTGTVGTDYTATSGTLNFGDGVGFASFPVTLLSRPAGTASRTVNLALSAPTGGAALDTITAAVLTVAATPSAGGGSPGTLGFGAATAAATAPGTATLTVLRTGGVSGAVGVGYATSDGTAAAGTDYAATTGTLSFADGVPYATVPVAILAGSTGAPARTFAVTLANATGGATLGGTTCTVTVARNPGIPGGYPDIRAAIHAALRADPTVAGFVAARTSTGKPPVDRPGGVSWPFPFIELIVVSSASTYTTGLGYFDNLIIQLSAYSTSDTEAKSIGAAAVKAINNATLSFQGGYPMSVRATASSPLQDPGQGPLGQVLWHQITTVTAVVGRSTDAIA